MFSTTSIHAYKRSIHDIYQTVVTSYNATYLLTIYDKLWSVHSSLRVRQEPSDPHTENPDEYIE